MAFPSLAQIPARIPKRRVPGSASTVKMEQRPLVVVRVDEIADSELKELRSRYGKNAPKWTEQFDDVCTRATTLVQEQMRQQLDTIAADGPDATLETVKAKYKALVKQHHPDANGGDRSTEDRLIEIIKAYNYLKTVVRGAS